MIIVTAARRAQPLQNVPFSVSVVDGDTLAEEDGKNLKGYVGTVPGLSAQSVSGYGNKYSIRGISTDGSGSELHPLTGVYFDESPLTYGAGYSGASYSPDPQLIDIDRIEVLRGPQGTLFGANSMGGAVRIIPKAPDPTQREGFIDANGLVIDGGGTGSGVDAAYNLPLFDGKAAVRVVGYYQRTDGWIDNLARGEKNVNSNEVEGLRLAGRYNLGSRWQFDSKFVIQNDHRGGNLWDDERLALDQQNRPNAEPSNDRWSLYNFVANYKGDGYKITSSTTYLQRHSPEIIDVTDLVTLLFDVNPPVPSYFSADDRYRDLTEELRIQSDGNGKLDWLAGLFVQNQRYDFFQTDPAPGLDAATGGAAAAAGDPNNLGDLDYHDSLHQYALFADFTYHFSRYWAAGVGTREFLIRQQTRAASTGLFYGTTDVPSQSSSESGNTPRASIQYFPQGPNGAASFYVNAAKGFRPGGSNPPISGTAPGCSESLAALGVTTPPDSFKSDSLWSYELGTRTHWLGNRLHVDAAVYHVDWSNFQAGVSAANCGIEFFVNAGKIYSDGVEAEITARLPFGFELQSGGNVSDPHYAQDVPYLAATKGDRLLSVPRYTYNTALRYALPHEGSYLRLDWQYEDGYYNFQYQRNIAGFGTLNANLVWDFGPLQGRLEVRNILDDRGTIDEFHPTDTYTWLFREQPRTYSVGVSVPFR